jgi:hypothetical protein
MIYSFIAPEFCMEVVLLLILHSTAILVFARVSHYVILYLHSSGALDFN